jgi:hypothetical protein
VSICGTSFFIVTTIDFLLGTGPGAASIPPPSPSVSAVWDPPRRGISTLLMGLIGKIHSPSLAELCHNRRVRPPPSRRPSLSSPRTSPTRRAWGPLVRRHRLGSPSQNRDCGPGPVS